MLCSRYAEGELTVMLNVNFSVMRILETYRLTKWENVINISAKITIFSVKINKNDKKSV